MGLFKRFLVQGFILIILVFLVFLSFSTLMPIVKMEKKVDDTEFSVARAFEHVKNISKEPHYVGSCSHSEVRNYIVNQLQDIGLQVHTQNGYVMNKQHIMTNAENIITRIEGANPKPGSDLLILGHYDSGPHSAIGAADDASAIGAILESLRAFKARGNEPENNITILISDAEEIGLLGAQLFVEEHDWIDNVGLTLNFEARGTGGPSNAILETNHGNGNLIKAFSKSKPHFPMTSSLMYEIYKNMPNDTDATVFREKKDIPGIFFAFIDRHYNYHTAADTPENLDINSLAHQGSYLMTALPYFSGINLEELKGETNQVYFNFPLFKIFHYSYSWIYPLLIVAWLLFIVFFFYGFRSRKLKGKLVGKGLRLFFMSITGIALIGFLGWMLIENLYPAYTEIQQGFPYNGHDYIIAFCLLSLGIFFLIYRFLAKSEYFHSFLVAPIVFWLLINTGLAIAFKGASYFVIPLLFLELIWGIGLLTRKPNFFVAFIGGIPAIFIFSPLIVYVPVALGIKFVFGGLLLLVLLCGLLLPIFYHLKSKAVLAAIFILGGISFFIKAGVNSDFSTNRPKPNSLVYELDLDTQEAVWKTYDGILDDWTRQVLSDPQVPLVDSSVMASKYGQGISYFQKTESLDIPGMIVEVNKDSLGENTNKYRLKLNPERKINRIVLSSPNRKDFINLMINDIEVQENAIESSKMQKSAGGESRRILTCYPAENDTLVLDFELPKDFKTHIDVQAASHDLLDNPWIELRPREKDQMPRPFVLNDAILTKQRIRL